MRRQKRLDFAARRWALRAILMGTIFGGTALAQQAPPPITTGDLKVMADTIWVLVTAFLVFWMNAGFGCVESGLCRAKNATNILGDRKSTRLNSSHIQKSRMPSSA